jgi:hypothetical protein
MSSHIPNIQSLYARLDIQLTATRKKMRKADKDLDVRLHPDKVISPERLEATAAFQALHDAYEYCLSKVGTHYAKPIVEEAGEEGTSCANEGEEAFWCARDDVPAGYVAMAGGTSSWKESDTEAPKAWINWPRRVRKRSGMNV